MVDVCIKFIVEASVFKKMELNALTKHCSPSMKNRSRSVSPILLTLPIFQ